MIPTLFEWDGPAVVTSVRTDIVEATLGKRRAMGDVHIFEPTGRLLSGEAVTGWNPIPECIEWDNAVTAANWLSEAKRQSSRDLREGSFWFGLAAQLLAPMLHAAAYGGRKMSEVVRWVKEREGAEVRALLADSPEKEARRSFLGIQRYEDRALSGIYATLASSLSAFDVRGVQQSSDSGFDVPSLFDGRSNTLYLCAPPDEQESLAPLFTALIRRVLREAYDRDASGDPLPKPLLILLDEAGNIAPLENLDTLATTAAGTRVQLVTVFHDLSQMTALYGDAKASSIANNHSALLLLPGNRDPRTNALVLDLLGTDRVRGSATKLSDAGGLRRLAQGTALCLYEQAPPAVLVLRSSTHDDDFRRRLMQFGSIDTHSDILRFGRSSVDEIDPARGAAAG